MNAPYPVPWANEDWRDGVKPLPFMVRYCPQTGLYGVRDVTPDDDTLAGPWRVLPHLSGIDATVAYERLAGHAPRPWLNSGKTL